MQAKKLISLLALALAVQGCQPKTVAAPPPPPPPPPPPHMGPPPAAKCNVAPFKVADGGTATVEVTVSNEGGYCAATLTAASGRPFDAPLVPVLPQHGTPRVVKYDGKTSVEYVPETGFTGKDHFVVRLLVKDSQGVTTLNVNVTAVPGH